MKEVKQVMKKNLLKVSALIMVLMLIFAMAGCSKTDEEAEGAMSEEVEEAAEEAEETAEAAVDAAEYGYSGTDPIEAEVYKYVAEELSKGFDKAEYSIPVVTIIDTDASDENDIRVWGDFSVNNYNVDGDTLKCVAGGNFPGCIHIAKDADGYKVTGMDQVKDGGEFESSAKEIFGDRYDEFMKVNSDNDSREAIRAQIASVYTKAHDIPVTKYQDEGWDPVDLAL